jgi:hypothetical protein
MEEIMEQVELSGVGIGVGVGIVVVVGAMVVVELAEQGIQQSCSQQQALVGSASS